MNLLERRRNSGSVWDFMNEIEQMFEGTTSARELSQFQPRVDVKETSDNYLICADLPGVPRDQIKVEFNEGRLTISGERSSEKVSDENRVHRVERTFGRFERSFQMPNDANGEQVQARFEDGVLEVLVPKTTVSKARTIQVESDKKGLFSKLLNQTAKTERKDDH